MTKEQLREKFDEEYEGDKEQLYPLLANSVFDFFWTEIEKRDKAINEMGHTIARLGVEIEELKGQTPSKD